MIKLKTQIKKSGTKSTPKAGVSEETAYERVYRKMLENRKANGEIERAPENVHTEMEVEDDAIANLVENEDFCITADLGEEEMEVGNAVLQDEFPSEDEADSNNNAMTIGKEGTQVQMGAQSSAHATLETQQTQ